MRFVKGTSGNPKGRPKKGTTFADRLHKALRRKYGGQTAADLVVNAVIKRAVGGDMRAIEFIANRVDGRVSLGLEHSGQRGRPIETRNGIIHVHLNDGDDDEVEAQQI